MIKAAGRAGNSPLLIIGLSAENLRRLADDQPILFNTAELGLPPMEVIVCAGATEDDIAEQLREAFPPAGAR